MTNMVRSARCRSILLAGSAHAFLAIATGAQADPLTISNTHNEPVATATASNGSPGDVTIKSGGSVQVGSGTAVTINSNNTVDNSGTIQAGGSNTTTNSTAVLIDGAHPITMTLDNQNSITVTGDSTSSGNYGIRLMNGPVSGTIASTSAGSVTVAGTNSFGVSIESPFTGPITLNGVTVTGDNSTAISLSAPITGSVTLTGVNGASVAGGTGFISTGAISGSLVNDGALSAGVTQSSNSGSNTVTPAAAGVAAMWIGSNVGGGFLNDRFYTDGSGNRVPDASATSSDTLTTGTLTGITGTTALVIQPTAANPQNIELKPYGSGDDDFGVVNRGTITTSATDANSSATAVSISGATINATNYTATIDNGLVSQANGSITASANGGNATGIYVGTLATVPVIRNEGTISATTSLGGGTSANAYGIRVDVGGHVPSVVNSGTITATTIGQGTAAYGILDSSGTLTSVNNSGTITAAASGNGSVSRAIDLSAGSGAETVANSGTITGDIALGNGDDSYSANSGTLNGTLAYGSGSNTLSLAGASTVTSLAQANGGALAVALGDTSLLRLDQSVALSSLAASGQSTLVIPVTSGNTPLTITGAAAFTGQSKVAIDLTTQDFSPTLTVLTANGGLTTDHAATLLDATSVPFVYSLTGDTVTADSIEISLARRTGAEAGFAPGLAPLYDQSFAAFGNGAAFQAIANLPDQKSVFEAYRQLEPGNYGSGILRIAQSTESAAATQVQARGDALLWAPPKAGDANTGWPLGIWTQETNQILHKSDSQTDPGFHGTVWGFTLGADHSIGRDFYAGLAASFEWGQLNFAGVRTNASNALRQNGQQISFYGGGHHGPLFAQFAVSGGLDHYNSNRAITIGDLTASKLAKWNGSQLAAQVTIGARFRLGRSWIEPSDTFSYLRLDQKAYVEQGGGVLDLAVDSQHLKGDTNAAKLATGYGLPMGEGLLSLELRGSYISQLDHKLAALDVRYVSGGDPFALNPSRLPNHEIQEALGLGYSSRDSSWHFALDGDHEQIQGYSDTGAAVTARVNF